MTIWTGLSPRGRGNPRIEVHVPVGQGSIPAWAGEPALPSPTASPSWVYPRVGGGTTQGQAIASRSLGLSPRGRGNPNVNHPGNWYGRSIPAWAGEPGPRAQTDGEAAVYPRVGGGTPEGWYTVDDLAGLSPRGRGNLAREHRLTAKQRSIPAWAGEPRRDGTLWMIWQVYPRVGGGTCPLGTTMNRGDGLSPRGRGNRVH